MSGCGLVKEDTPPPPPSMKYMTVIAGLLFMPIAVTLSYRRRQLARRRI